MWNARTRATRSRRAARWFPVARWALRFPRWIFRGCARSKWIRRAAPGRDPPETGDAAVFDSRLGLEFECGDHRAGIDLGDVAADFKFGAFLLDGARTFLQLAFVHFFAALGGMQQAG